MFYLLLLPLATNYLPVCLYTGAVAAAFYFLGIRPELPGTQ